MAGWSSSSTERMTDWPGPKYRIGENVGRERSKMRSPHGDSPFRYGWIWRRGEEMEGRVGSREMKARRARRSLGLRVVVG